MIVIIEILRRHWRTPTALMSIIIVTIRVGTGSQKRGVSKTKNLRLINSAASVIYFNYCNAFAAIVS